MSDAFRETDLEAYLDEALPSEEMSRIESALRGNSDLARRLVAINARRDAGAHSLGDVWRRHRISCADRSELGSYLLGVLDDAQAGYIKFHLEQIGCRICRANLEDLKNQQQEAASAAGRRRKYFQSSASYLKPLE